MCTVLAVIIELIFSPSRHEIGYFRDIFSSLCRPYCSYVVQCACISLHNCRTQYSSEQCPVIFCLNLRTSIMAQMLLYQNEGISAMKASSTQASRVCIAWSSEFKSVYHSGCCDEHYAVLRFDPGISRAAHSRAHWHCETETAVLC